MSETNNGRLASFAREPKQPRDISVRRRKISPPPTSHLQLPEYHGTQQHQVREYHQTSEEYPPVYRLPPQFPRPGGGVLVVRVPVLLVADHRHVAEAEAGGDVLPLRRHEPDDDSRPVQGEGYAEDGRVHPGEDQAARIRRRQRLEEFPVQRTLVLRVASLPVVLVVVVLLPPLLLLLLIAPL